MNDSGSVRPDARLCIMPAYSNTPTLKAAVIGYGGAYNMGKAHLDLMQAAGMVPAAVVEIDPERLAVATQDFPGIELYDSVDTFLSNSDANVVAVITPHDTHADLGLRCLRAGKHVVMEKPMAITGAECDALIDAAKAKDLLVTTFHNRHWDGCILRAKKVILDEKRIGSVYRIDLDVGIRGQIADWWRSSNRISGGALYDWGVHLLEYSFQVVRGKPLEVSGYRHHGYWKTRWNEDTIDDEIGAMIRLDDGAVIQLKVTTLDPQTGRNMVTFYGTEGSYGFDMDGYELLLRENGVETAERGPNPPGEQTRFYPNIADAIQGKDSLVITPEYAASFIRIIELCHRSALEGRTLPFPAGT